MTDLYAVVPVSDKDAGLAWYTTFFGRPPDEVIGEEALWRVGANAWLVLDHRPERTGRANITLGVTGADEIIARWAAGGIEPELAETYGNGVRHVVVRDPDDNELALAESPPEWAARFRAD